MKKAKQEIKDIVVISDTHCGSTFGLCLPEVDLDDGGVYRWSPLQKRIGEMWEDFWKWTKSYLNGRPFIVVHNGDIIDGDHHGCTSIISRNLVDQERLAVACIAPHIQDAEAYYQIRGTEAHVGQSAQFEERVAKQLGAVKDPETKRHSRWEMWVSLGDELIHFAHHIGVTSSSAYESSAVMREIVAAFTEAGQHGERPPSIIVRSHRHRYIEVKPLECRALVTPGWQGKTSFVHKIDRLRAPMFGGVVISQGDEGVHIREKIYRVKRTGVVKI